MTASRRRIRAGALDGRRAGARRAPAARRGPRARGGRRARAARAEAAAAEARAAVDGWRRAHADLRTAHDALGEEVRRNAAEIARLRSERAAPARESRLRASADLAPPPPPPPVSRQPPPGSRPTLAPQHLAAGPTPLAAFAPAQQARRGLPAAPGRPRARGAAAGRRADALLAPRRRALRDDARRGPRARGARLLKESCWS